MTSKGLMQEKFQKTAPSEPQELHEWANMSYGDTTHIRKIYRPNRSEFYESDKTGAPDEGNIRDYKLNYMPPGMFIDNQEPMVTERAYRFSAAGASDVSNKTDAA